MECLAPKIEVKFCESSIVESGPESKPELVEETPVKAKNPKDMFAEKMKQNSLKKKESGIGAGSGLGVQSRGKRAPPKNNKLILGSDLLDTSKLSGSNRNFGSETSERMGSMGMGSESEDKNKTGQKKRTPVKAMSNIEILKEGPVEKNNPKVSGNTNLQIPVPNFKKMGSKGTGTKSPRSQRSVDPDRFAEFKEARSRGNSRSTSPRHKDGKAKGTLNKAAGKTSSINMFVQKTSANISPRKR